MQDILKLQAEICKAFAHPQRIELIKILCDKEITAGELLEKVKINKVNLSQHMAILINKGIVSSRKHGKNVSYKLADTRIIKACNLMREVLLTALEQKHFVFKKAKKL